MGFDKCHDDDTTNTNKLERMVTVCVLSALYLSRAFLMTSPQRSRSAFAVDAMLSVPKELFFLFWLGRWLEGVVFGRLNVTPRRDVRGFLYSF